MGKSKQYVLVCTVVMLTGGVFKPNPVSAQDSAVPPWEVLDDYCLSCHNFEDFAGGIAFDVADRGNIHGEAEVWEKAVRKLRTGLMPPVGEPRPRRQVLDGVAAWFERELDSAEVINPGFEGLSRLNRAEYANAVRDLLAYDASTIVNSLPEDVTVDGFDNIAEALTISPTLLEGYIAAAMEISRQAVGNRSIGATDIHYNRAGRGVQLNHIDGQALGTRGGMTIEHNFPLDAEYVLRISANIQEAGWKNDEGRMWWCNGPTVDVSFNGVQIPVEDYRSFRLRVPAGPQQISVALVDDRKCAGVGELYLGEALASVGGAVQEIEIQGPFNPSGVTDTPSRQKIFICRPEDTTESDCAREILSHLATRAYRRPVQADAAEIDVLMDLYDIASTEEGGNFELGIQYALSRLLVDPQFLYRFEEEPSSVAEGEVYRISDLELASRLSFFLWSSIPDEELLGVAVEGGLSDPDVLAAQVRRMLEDERAWALVENFAGQWLRLRELEQAAPQDGEFDEDLRTAFRQETELFFAGIMREGRSLLELLDADYTYVNERLAMHYGFEGVRGSYMRRVELPEGSPRGGLLGQGSILTATSIPNRTSPVVRGVWIVESLLGAPVPEPPPGVETDLPERADERGNVQVETLRERLEMHRANPPCAGCHGIMDPVGLALENFDLVGRWRETDNGLRINTQSALVDGTRLNGPQDLRRALLSRSDAFIRALTEKLLTYALGRELEYYDGPAVRKIAGQAARENYTLASLVQGIAASDPFQKRIKLNKETGSSAGRLAAGLAGTQ